MTARVARVRVDASACTSRTFAPESQSQTRAVPSTEHVANATRLPKDFTDEFATSSGCACANARAVPVAISTSHALPADVVTTPHGSVSGLVCFTRRFARVLASKLAATTAPSSSNSPTSSHPPAASSLTHTRARRAPPTKSRPPGNAFTTVTASLSGNASAHLTRLGGVEFDFALTSFDALTPVCRLDRHTEPLESPTYTDPSEPTHNAVHTGSRLHLDRVFSVRSSKAMRWTVCEPVVPVSSAREWSQTPSAPAITNSGKLECTHHPTAATGASVRAASTSVPVATSQTRNAPSGSAAADRSKAPSGENFKETTHPPARSCRISFRHAPVDASHIQTTHTPGPLASARTSDADADAMRLVSGWCAKAVIGNG
mmetsp:Transcript_1791/g.8016  ORF Transcript_1791/g.8016 Transcript_1791/m.8016 type:complete len:374 (+) Transcript_1791:540-1661(+)